MRETGLEKLQMEVLIGVEDDLVKNESNIYIIS